MLEKKVIKTLEKKNDELIIIEIAVLLESSQFIIEIILAKSKELKQVIVRYIDMVKLFYLGEK